MTPNNTRQTTGRHADTRRQPLKKDDQKSKRNNRFDALADKLIEDNKTSRQSGTTDGETTTNQQLTQTADQTERKMTNSIDFPPITNLSITFDFESKIEIQNVFQ